MAFPRSIPFWIGGIALTILLSAAMLRPRKPPEAPRTPAPAAPRLPTPPAPAEARIIEPPKPEAVPEDRMAALVARLKAARTPVEWAAGLHELPAAGTPEAVWEGLRTLLREGPPAMTPAVAEKMTAIDPPQAVTALAGILNSPAEPERLAAAARALHTLAKSSPPLAGPAAAALAHAGLRSADRSVRLAVLQALAEVATPAEAPRLKEYAAGESDRELRELAERAAAR